MHLLVLAAWSFFFVPPPITEPFKFFKPDAVYYGPVKAHWKATECAVDDDACLTAHDDRVFARAVMAGDVRTCWDAAAPGWCAVAVRNVLKVPPVRTIISDPFK
jgi:hypothetical protein